MGFYPTCSSHFKRVKIKLILILIMAAYIFARNEHYIGWKSYFVRPISKDHVRALVILGEKLDLDFLSPPHPEREALVLVPPKHQLEFITRLKYFTIKYWTHAENVKAALDHDDELLRNWTNVILRGGGTVMPYNSYLNLDAIYAYMHDVSMRHQKTVTMVTAGHSFEGRPLRYLKISTTNFQRRLKKIIFIDSGIHAREWIAPPVVTWIIHKLTDDVTEPKILDDFDWILMPIVNPDGYEFSFSKKRLWRKTRSTDTNPKSYRCPGVDGNRNFDFAWGATGTSSNPCSEIYRGNKAFSEVEIRAVRDIFQTYFNRMSMYISMHSFGSMILYPWGHNSSVSKYSFNLHLASSAMIKAIKNASLPNFPAYVNGNSVQTIFYTAGGAADDYAHNLGIPYSYTFELPGLSGGMEGFELDPMYIEQVCTETWLGIVAGITKTIKLAEKDRS
ncbi:unnamed protein product [Spodoptera littoralis]|uniref:Peptidase M14 domain-containing protein n=1 Tax=Spodoptera littoralis TaxID=7109 RepID=A0A9P0MVA9_SPOLI|nr:unnamed protein product [Spodoptera littoralis]CAH1634681.1 unnamed protein product [Spodoptera littoralis]